MSADGVSRIVGAEEGMHRGTATVTVRYENHHYVYQITAQLPVPRDSENGAACSPQMRTGGAHGDGMERVITQTCNGRTTNGEIMYPIDYLCDPDSIETSTYDLRATMNSTWFLDTITLKYFDLERSKTIAVYTMDTTKHIRDMYPVLCQSTNAMMRTAANCARELLKVGHFEGMLPWLIQGACSSISADDLQAMAAAAALWENARKIMDVDEKDAGDVSRADRKAYTALGRMQTGDGRLNTSDAALYNSDPVGVCRGLLNRPAQPCPSGRATGGREIVPPTGDEVNVFLPYITPTTHDVDTLDPGMGTRVGTDVCRLDVPISRGHPPVVLPLRFTGSGSGADPVGIDGPDTTA
jgi:hypothetical protein